MKQHLYEREILEMNDELIIKLMKLVYKDIPKDMLKFRIKQYVNHKLGSKQLSVEMNVGKMLEILSYYEGSWNLNFLEGEYHLQIDQGMGPMELFNENLCNLLWLAVKYVLSE